MYTVYRYLYNYYYTYYKYKEYIMNTNRKTRDTVSIVKPKVDRELVDYLMDVYPEVIPSPDTSIESIMKQAGKRELVLQLRRMAYESD